MVQFSQLLGLGTWPKYSLALLGLYLSAAIQTENSATLVLHLHLNTELEQYHSRPLKHSWAHQTRYGLCHNCSFVERQ